MHKATWYGTVVAAKVLKNTSDIALGDFRAEIEVLRKVGTEFCCGQEAERLLGAHSVTLTAVQLSCMWRHTNAGAKTTEHSIVSR